MRHIVTLRGGVVSLLIFVLIVTIIPHYCQAICEPNGSELIGHEQTFSDDSAWLATNSNERVVRILNVRTGINKTTLHGFHAPVTALAFSSQAKYLFIGESDGTVLVTDPNSAKTLCYFTGMGAVVGLASSRTTDVVAIARYITSDRMTKVSFIHAFTRKEFRTVAVEGKAVSMQLAPDDLIWAGTTNQPKADSGNLLSYSYRTNLKYKNYSVSGDLNHISVSSDGTKIVCAFDDASYSVFDGRGSDSLKRYVLDSIEGHCNCVTFGCYNTDLVVADDAGNVLIIRFKKNADIRIIESRVAGNTDSMILSADCQYLALHSPDSGVKLVDLHSVLCGSLIGLKRYHAPAAIDD